VQKFGRANENTPAKWNASYKDFNRTDDGSSLLVAQTTSTAEVLAAPAIPPVGITSAQQAEAEAETGAAMDVDTKSSKKRKSRDDDEEEETTEDKAERKRKKKEEKEKKRADKAAKKEKRKSKGGDDEDSD
jgi:H/ACA ribonucleoprotein complex subunit 4